MFNCDAVFDSLMVVGRPSSICLPPAPVLPHPNDSTVTVSQRKRCTFRPESHMLMAASLAALRQYLMIGFRCSTLLLWDPLITVIFHCVLTTILVSVFCMCWPPPSNRHHRSNDDCLEGKRRNYQVCSVQYYVQQLCTVQCTHIWTELTVACWLDLAFLWLYYVLQFICVRFSFLGDYFVL